MQYESMPGVAPKRNEARNRLLRRARQHGPDEALQVCIRRGIDCDRPPVSDGDVLPEIAAGASVCFEDAPRPVDQDAAAAEPLEKVEARSIPILACRSRGPLAAWPANDEFRQGSTTGTSVASTP